MKQSTQEAINEATHIWKQYEDYDKLTLDAVTSMGPDWEKFHNLRTSALEQFKMAAPRLLRQIVQGERND